MRLKRVRIFGFKTFADKAEFNIEGGLVAVVGPNGCGKSNLVDAILWGLGEGNARHLRAQSSADVIFGGSSRRKPLGYAEVNLLFDNDDGVLPIDASEVSIGRKVNRAGESEYSINRQNCRQRDIYDLLADSGLGRAGYSIVGQKEIDQALSASPEERRGWVDEAAGVQRYRVRKQESQKRLAAAQSHLQRVYDVLRELHSQREPLEEEAEVALRYRSMLNSLREVESGLLVNDVVKAIREIEGLENKISDAQRLIRDELARADDLESVGRKVGERISDVEREMDSVRGLQQGSLTALERAEAELRLAEQRLQSLADLETSLGEEGAHSEHRIVEAEQEVSALQIEVAAERENLERIRTECGGAGQEAKLLREELRAIEREVAEARNVHAKHLKYEAERAHRMERLDEAERELQGIVDALPDLKRAVEQAKAEWDKSLGEAHSLETELKQKEAGLTEISRREDEDAQNARKWLAERAALEGRRRGIEHTIENHEGLNQGSRAVLDARDNGILKAKYVPVGEAVETERELALAIETALGASANDLIVEDEADAKAAIAYLKEHRLGRATFQPIPLMKPANSSPEMRKLLGERGVVGRASELIQCDPRFKPVIESLLGRVVIVEDIDVALKFARSAGWSRLVTVQGEVVHSSGAVTGGQTNKTAYGLVQRKADLAELTTQIEELDELVERAEERTAKRLAERGAILASLSDQRNAIDEKSLEAREAKSFHDALLDELTSATRSQGRLDHELSALKTPQTEADEDVDLGPLEARRDEILKALAAKTADGEGAEARMRDGQLRLQQSEMRLQAGERRVRAASEAEQMRQRKLGHLEPDRERIRNEIEHHGKQKEKATSEKQAADARLEVARGQKAALLEESLRLSEETKAARANASTIGDGMHQAELNRARADARRTASLQRLMEDYGLTEDDALAQEGQVEVPPDAATLVNKLRRELKSMGEVNLGAIEAFERLKERCDELDAQQADIIGGIEQVQASILELDKLTRERFLTTFASVQVAFEELFQKLFGGGEGKIQLTNPDSMLESGVEIDVTLPGKRQQRLELLSGGERALCACAFLFSLLKVKPSPLVVLDEVDAPLDGRNVERFIALLQEFTEWTQFIVITHNPTTIAAAPVWLGVTMQEPGVSALVPAILGGTDSKLPPEVETTEGIADGSPDRTSERSANRPAHGLIAGN
jgi:chromosome segregation protein